MTSPTCKSPEAISPAICSPDMAPTSSTLTSLPSNSITPSLPPKPEEPPTTTSCFATAGFSILAGGSSFAKFLIEE